MDVLLVSARPAGAHPSPTAQTVARLGRGLADDGHRVRWLCPSPDPTALSAATLAKTPGVDVSLVATRPPAFRHVTGRIHDLATETRLVEMLRDDPADLVHVHGFGGPSSHLTTWLADRLGVPSVVVATQFAELVCHRGDLRFGAGATCSAWDDPSRCQDCCNQPCAGGLTGPQAAMARLLRPFGGLSPFPSRVDFANRNDMIFGGLSLARRVVVEDEHAAAALKGWGLTTRQLCIGVPPAEQIQTWLNIYRQALA